MPSEITTCPVCHNEIDEEVCWCGDLIKFHNPMDCGHNPVPLGCTCGYVGTVDMALPGSDRSATVTYRRLAPETPTVTNDVLDGEEV